MADNFRSKWCRHTHTQETKGAGLTRTCSKINTLVVGVSIGKLSWDPIH